MSLRDYLGKLSNACGVTGRESQVRILLTEMLEPYADKIQIDTMENVIATKEGRRGSPKIMLAAHMDEVGLMVKNITKDGFIQAFKLGGIDDRILPAQKLVVHTKSGSYPGVFGSKPPHFQKEDERKKVVAFDELFIDIGAENREHALNMGVAVGDPIVFDTKFTEMPKDNVMGKAFDNRAGCAAMVEALKLLKETDCTVCAVGTVQEEVGLRGVAGAAFGVDPDLALALDVTTAGDFPGIRESDTNVKMGKGPAITLSDSGLITHPKVLRWLQDAAEEEKIPIQIEAGLPGSTDAARISVTRQGIPSGTISIPTRYIHSPVSVLNLRDVENCAKLATVAIQKISKYF